MIAEAFHIASTGGPARCSSTSPRTCCGAVHLRLAPQLDLPGYKPNTKPHSRQVREAAKLIAEARKPVLYVGGGVIRGRPPVS